VDDGWFLCTDCVSILNRKVLSRRGPRYLLGSVLAHSYTLSRCNLAWTLECKEPLCSTLQTSGIKQRKNPSHLLDAHHDSDVPTANIAGGFIFSACACIRGEQSGYCSFSFIAPLKKDGRFKGTGVLHGMVFREKTPKLKNAVPRPF